MSSHSSTESEIIALDHAMRNEGIPLLNFLQFLASGGKTDGARGDSSTRMDHRGNTVADNKGAKGDPSTHSANRHVPRLIVFEDSEAVIKIDET